MTGAAGVGGQESRSVIPREDRNRLLEYLESRVAGEVGIDLWTRTESALVAPGRDPCTYCGDAEQLIRELATLHSGLRLTRYDLDRHAERAREAGIERAPTLVLRSAASGASITLVGYFAGELFPALVDALVIASAPALPFGERVVASLDGLQHPHTVEMYVAAYDPYSAMMARLGAAIAMGWRLLRVRVTEVGEFPTFAQMHAITEVPALVIDGQRFPGLWTEATLAEQLRRIDAGEQEPVVRDRVIAQPYVPFVSLRDAPPDREPPTGGGSGLIVPGR